MKTTMQRGTTKSTRLFIYFILFWIVFMSGLTIFSLCVIIKNKDILFDKKYDFPPIEFLEVEGGVYYGA